jgi:hypothetical protein
MRARVMEAEPPYFASRQGDLDAPAGKAAVNLVEHLRKGRRSNSRKQTTAGRETAVRANQMLAARAHDRQL